MRKPGFSLLLAVTVFASAAMAQDFPSSPGRETMLRVCTACHGLESIPNLRYSKGEWQELVYSMADKGADASGDELDEIVAYLTKNFGKPAPKLNINKASDADLMSSLQLTAKEAVAVVAYRKAHGDFRSADDLAKVEGLDGKKIDAIKDKIAF